MNEELQTLIIKELGLIGTLALIGTILVTALIPDNTTTITILFGAVTATIGALSGFLNGKNMTEKQEEIIYEQTIQEQDDENT